MSRPGRAGRRGCLTPVVFAAALVCIGAFLIILFGGEVPVPGRCPTGFGWGTPGGAGEAKELLEDQNFEASPAAVRDLEAGIVDERLVSSLQAAAKEHRVCVTAFKEGHYFLPGVPESTIIPDGYGEAGGLPNTHYFGRAADIRYVDGEPVEGNGASRAVLDIGRIFAGLPPARRPDQIIGPESWTRELGFGYEEGWVLERDQLDLHDEHIHLGYTKARGTRNTR